MPYSQRITPEKSKDLDLALFDAIILDVGNVIIYDFPVEIAYSFFVSEEIKARKLDFKPKASEILYSSRNHTNLFAGFTYSNLWGEVNSNAWQRVLENWDAFCIPIPGVIDVIRKLASKRLIILANQPKQMLPVLKNLGIYYLFEEIILDSIVGISKPNTKIYEYAINKLNLKPALSLMIGDRLDNDVIPAKMIGIPVVWIKKKPIDKTLSIPIVSEEWKDHYHRISNEILDLDSRNLPEKYSQFQPDYVMDSLADIIC